MELPNQTATKYANVGFCMYCLLTLEAKQPGGTDVRHKGTGVPYNQCEQAKARLAIKKK
jgi:hypothetical protein